MTQARDLERIKAEIDQLEQEGNSSDPRDLMEEYFDLLALKREIEHRVKTNHAQTVAVLVNAGMFDAFNVNWNRLAQMLQRRP